MNTQDDNEHCQRVPRYKLIAHIRQQIELGTYANDARTEAALRRMIEEMTK